LLNQLGVNITIQEGSPGRRFPRGRSEKKPAVDEKIGKFLRHEGVNRICRLANLEEERKRFAASRKNLLEGQVIKPADYSIERGGER